MEDHPGGRIFVWRSNAAEQAEAAFLKLLEPSIREFANDPSNQLDMAALFKVGTEKQHPWSEISRRIIAHTLLSFHGIENPKK